MYDAISAPALLVLGGWPALVAFLGLLMIGAAVFLIVTVRRRDLRRDELPQENADTAANESNGEDLT